MITPSLTPGPAAHPASSSAPVPSGEERIVVFVEFHPGNPDLGPIYFAGTSLEEILKKTANGTSAGETRCSSHREVSLQCMMNMAHPLLSTAMLQIKEGHSSVFQMSRTQ